MFISTPIWARNLYMPSQLERAELQHVPVVVARGHRVGETLADVAAQGGVHPGVAHDLVDERRGGGLAVRAGDADAFRPAQVTARELHFRNDGNACRTDFPHYGGRFGDPWRLDDLRVPQGCVPRCGRLPRREPATRLAWLCSGRRSSPYRRGIRRTLSFWRGSRSRNR